MFTICRILENFLSMFLSQVCRNLCFDDVYHTFHSIAAQWMFYLRHQYQHGWKNRWTTSFVNPSQFAYPTQPTTQVFIVFNLFLRYFVLLFSYWWTYYYAYYYMYIYHPDILHHVMIWWWMTWWLLVHTKAASSLDLSLYDYQYS